MRQFDENNIEARLGLAEKSSDKWDPIFDSWNIISPIYFNQGFISLFVV